MATAKESGLMTSGYSDLVRIPGHQYMYKNPKSGKIHYKGTHGKFSCKTDKIGAAIRYRDEKIAEKFGPAAKGKIERKKTGVINPLVADLWKELLKVKSSDITKSTMLTYNKNWTHGMTFWHDMHAKDITSDNIVRYKLWYLENHPTRHALKTVIHFRALVRHAHAQGCCRLPDMSALDTLNDTVNKTAKREKVGRVYTDAEISAIIKACGQVKTNALAVRARRGILLGAFAGLRKNEALSLKWENIDFKKGILRIWSQKNHKWREVPMLKVIGEALSLGGKEPGAYVFPMPTNKARPISSQIFDKVWVEVKGLAEISGRARFHDLRHTFATKTAEDGWPPISACDVLDMSLITYQKIYAKPSMKNKAEWMSRTFGGSK